MLNYEVRQGDGGALTAEHWIRPGWTLELPGSHEGRARGGSAVDEHPVFESIELSVPAGRTVAAEA